MNALAHISRQNRRRPAFAARWGVRFVGPDLASGPGTPSGLDTRSSPTANPLPLVERLDPKTLFSALGSTRSTLSEAEFGRFDVFTAGDPALQPYSA